MCTSSICKHTRADVVLIVDEDDGEFNELKQVSDEQMSEIFGNLHPDMDGQNPGFEDIVACGWPKSEYDIDTWSEFIEYVEKIYELAAELMDPYTYKN